MSERSHQRRGQLLEEARLALAKSLADRTWCSPERTKDTFELIENIEKELRGER